MDLQALPAGVRASELKHGVIVTLPTLKSLKADGNPELNDQLQLGVPLDVQVERYVLHRRLSIDLRKDAEENTSLQMISVSILLNQSLRWSFTPRICHFAVPNLQLPLFKEQEVYRKPIG